MTSTILDRPPPPADARIPYGPGPLQFADLWRPSGGGPYPCVITIHGGFWRNRYRLSHLGHLCVALTDLGFVTWNVEYRRIGDPGGGWPGSFDDIARAARFVFEHAADLGIDPDRVVVLGHSAGGQLASWLASIANVPAGSSIRSTPLTIRGVVSLAGVLDLHEAWARDLSNGAVVDFLGGAPDEVPDRYAAASPFALLPSPAPHLVVHGTRDANVPAAISEAYATRAAAKGASVTSLILPGVDHFDIIDPESTVWPTIAAAIRNVIDSR